MEPSPEQWQELIDAIMRNRPNPLWPTLIPIVTTLFAVLGGFGLSQWTERAKAKRERNSKMREEIRTKRSLVVEYLTRWSHAAKNPVATVHEIGQTDHASNHIGLLVSLTGDLKDVPLALAFREYMDAWHERVWATHTTNRYGGRTYTFRSEDTEEMDEHRWQLLAALQSWEDGSESAEELVIKLKALGKQLASAKDVRIAEFAFEAQDRS